MEASSAHRRSLRALSAALVMFQPSGDLLDYGTADGYLFPELNIEPLF